MSSKSEFVLLLTALLIGALVAYVDSRPGWDDTGITVAVLLLTSGALGFLGPRKPWLWALAIGLWIPVVGILTTGSYSSILALIIALLGSYAGMGLRRGLAAI